MLINAFLFSLAVATTTATFVYADPESPHLRREEGGKIKEVLQDCQDCPELTIVEGGTHIMGPTALERYDNANESVIIDIPRFYISKREVTSEEWAACSSVGSCRPINFAGNNWSHPVHSITLSDIERYLSWLSSTTGATYRLPSEAEWEYAATAGAPTIFHWGNQPSRTYANYANDSASSLSESKSPGEGGLQPAGLLMPNVLGLHDTAGNVGEFTSDCYSEHLRDLPRDGSPRIVEDCSFVIIKGGNYLSLPFSIRPRFRTYVPSDAASPQLGFRVVRSTNYAGS